MSDRPARAHIVDWDNEFKRPIVDGHFTNPVTGEIQKAGRLGLTNGPPSIRITVINLNADVNFRVIGASTTMPLEKVYLAVANHVKDGVYRIVSLNMSEYAFVLVINIEVSAEQFDEAWRGKFRDRLDFGRFHNPMVLRESYLKAGKIPVE